MRNKRLLTLVLLFVVLVIFAIVLMQRPGEQSTVTGEGDLLAEIDSATISGVEIVVPAHRIRFEKRGGEWYLQEPLSYRADQGSIASLVGQIGSLRSAAVVSTNPAKRGLFQVDSTGTVITLHRPDKPSVSLVVGKMGTSYTETYVRLTASDDVHLVNAPLAAVARRGVNEWRDKTILKTPREEIRSVHYQYGDTVFTLAFQDSLWVVAGVRADDGVVENLLSSLSDVQADDFLDSAPQRPPVITATVTYAGKEIRFSEGRDANGYRVQASTDSQWFEMKSWRAGQILKREADLRARTP